MNMLIHNNGLIASGDLAEEVRKVGWDFTNNRWFVMLMRIPEKYTAEMEVRQALHSLVSDSLNGSLPYMVHRESDRRVFFMVEHSGVPLETAMENTLKDIYLRVPACLHHCLFAVGSSVSELSDIERSAAQAEEIAEIAYIFDHENVLTYTLLRKDTALKYELLDILEKIVNAVDQENRQQAFEMLDVLEASIRNDQPNITIAQYIFIELLTKIQKVCETRKVVPDEEIRKGTVHQLFDEDACLSTFIGSIRALLTEVFLIYDKKNDLKGADMIKSVEEYIRMHYMETNLDVTQVATYFGFSNGYLSKLCKNCKGITIAQMIDNYRMNAARELLEDSEQTLDNVIKSAGYYDKNGFIRKFKALYGATPMQYRETKRFD